MKKEMEKNIMDGFILNNNYKLVEYSKGYCKMEAIVSDKSLNPYKIVHGGFLFGLADTSAGIASSTMDVKTVTVNANIDYFHPVKTGKIISEAKCIKEGKTISVFEVNLYDENGVNVARSTITYISIK